MSLYDTREIDKVKIVMMKGQDGDGVGSIFTLAGAGIAETYDSTTNIIYADILLHREPKEGDRILVLFTEKITSPSYITVYGETYSDEYTIELSRGGSVIEPPAYLDGVCVLEYNDSGWPVFRLVGMFEGINGIVPITKGGTGNADGYIRTGLQSGETAGTGATAEGNDTIASGDYSHAEGDGTGAVGDSSHAEGAYTIAEGIASHAEGNGNTASGIASHAEGGYFNPSDNNIASGDSSHAEGAKTTASGDTAHAEGYNTTASGGNAHAEGSGTTASNYHAHAEGYNTTASGNSSHAGGTTSVASGNHSFAHGQYVNAGYAQQTAFGRYNNNKSDNLFEVGNGTASNARSNAFEVTASGHAIDGQGNDLASVAALEASASGNPIIINAQPVAAKELSVEIEPIQDLHGYDKPWAGGAGKNKWSLGDINVESQSSISYSLPAGTYTISCDLAASMTLAIRFRYANNDSVLVAGINQSNPQTFTLASDCVQINTNITGFVTGTVIHNIQIESGSTATTFAPYSNICPISGRIETGVKSEGFNRWDEESEAGTINAATGATMSYENRIRSKNFNKCEPNKTYYGKIGFNVDLRIFWYTENKTYISYNTITNATATSPSNAAYFKISTEGTTYGTTYRNDICINLSDVALNGQYKPYKSPTSATTAFGQTVYGGTVDFDTGVVTVTDAIVSDMGALNWIRNTSEYAYAYYYVNIPDRKTGNNSPLISSIFKSGTQRSELNDNEIAPYNLSTSNAIAVRADQYTDVASFKTAVTGQTVCYKLATPTTLQLTPAMLELLKGYNYITADGDMDIVYIPESILPTAPTADGTYKLICTVANGIPTFSWAAN